jgi:hypothetical protein
MAFDLSNPLGFAAGAADLFTGGSVSSALAIAGGINALTGGGVSSALGVGPGKAATGTQAQNMADPFAPYRANMAQMYAGYMQPGGTTDITQMPGYSAFQTGVMDPALEASKRSAAKSGMLYSGNEMQALQKTGQQGYYGFMTDYLNRLATGAGAGYAPSQGAQIGLGQTAANQQAFSQGLGAVSTGLSGLYGTPNTTYGSGGAGGGITSAGMQAGGYTDIYGSAGDTVPLGYANF